MVSIQNCRLDFANDSRWKQPRGYHFFERGESERQCPVFSLWVLVSPLLTYTPFIFLFWYFHIRVLIGHPDLSQMSHLVIPLGIFHSWIISWKACPVLSFPHRCQILVLKRYKDRAGSWRIQVWYSFCFPP